MEKEKSPEGDTIFVLKITIPSSSILSKLFSENTERHVKTAQRHIKNAARITANTLLPLPTMLASCVFDDYRISGNKITKRQVAYAAVAVGLAVSTLWMIHEGNQPVEHPVSHHVECVMDCASFPNDSELTNVSFSHMPNASEMSRVAKLVP
ncbi:MAG: hypothetical protein PHW76_01310 [Alphaproteobacteria bacterium]|nr:hypothetical protein [Alphaproteobacteria bacterium]